MINKLLISLSLETVGWCYSFDQLVNKILKSYQFMLYDTNYIVSIIILGRAQPLANSKTCASFSAIIFRNLKQLTPLTYINCQTQTPFPSSGTSNRAEKFKLKNQTQNASYMVEGKILVGTFINVNNRSINLLFPLTEWTELPEVDYDYNTKIYKI